MRIVPILAVFVLLAACHGAVGSRVDADADVVPIALAVFESWAAADDEPYTDPQAKVIMNDGYFATVQVTARFRPSADAKWEERKAMTECKRVGTVWRCDDQFVFAVASSDLPQRTDDVAATPAAAPSAAQAANPVEGIIIGGLVLVLKEPAAHSPVLGRLTRNQPFMVVGQRGDCKWLQITDDAGLTGWVSASNRDITWNADCTTLPVVSLPVVRPNSSVLGRNFADDGKGKLNLQNSRTLDTIVVLTTPDYQQQVSAYVRNGESYAVGRVPDGVYELFYMTGSGWDGQDFTQDIARWKFADPIEFDTSRRYRTVWNVTLDSVPDGNAVTIPVTETEFPAVLVD